MTQKTYSQRKEDVKRNWKLFDADGQVLGRMATKIAAILRGKDKATFTPHIDGGDFVVVVNAAKIHLTGNKPETKMYYDHTRYRGGLNVRPAKELMKDDPEEMITRAVWGMLPKGSLGRDMIKKLHVYRGPSHPHVAQKPERGN